MDIRYKQIEQWKNPESKHYRHPTNEHHRIHAMLQDHDRQSAVVAWGFVAAAFVFAILVLAWVYAYIYIPMSGLWS